MKSQLSFALLLLASVSCKSDGASKKAQDPKSLNGNTSDAVEAPSVSIDAGPLVLPPAAPLPALPVGLPRRDGPDHNPTTAEKAALGALLFVDPAMSRSGTKSCSSCHQPDKGTTSGNIFDSNDDKVLNRRHTPSLVNLAYHEEFYWDGRAQPLESLILGHWPGQLGLAPDAMAARLVEHRLYAAHFQRAFGGEPTAHRSAEAIAAFLRTLRSGGSAWDHYEGGDNGAVSPEAIAGAEVFNKRGGCAVCHAPPLYTDLRYHDIGIPQAQDAPDTGRYQVTRQTNHKNAFKTPGLRGVLASAPYFHNGSAKDLDEVLRIKEALGSPKLSEEERGQLIAFLQALEAPIPALQELPQPPVWPEAEKASEEPPPAP